LENFEINLMSMEYPKEFYNNVTISFCCKKGLLKRCEMIWKWHLYEKTFMYTFTS
jgi:hypothetical protein